MPNNKNTSTTKNIITLIIEFLLSIAIGYLIVAFFIKPKFLWLYKNNYIIEKSDKIEITNKIIIPQGTGAETITENVKLTGEVISDTSIAKKNLRYLEAKDKKILLISKKKSKEIGTTFLNYENKDWTLFVYWHNWHTNNYIGNYLYNKLSINDDLKMMDVLDNEQDYIVDDVIDVQKSKVSDLNISSSYNVILFTCHPNSSKMRRIFLLKQK